jgi:hypothetical protein
MPGTCAGPCRMPTAAADGGDVAARRLTSREYCSHLLALLRSSLGWGRPARPPPATTAVAYCSVNQEVPSRPTPSRWNSQLARKSTEHQHQAHDAGCNAARRRHRRPGSTHQQLPARNALGEPSAAAAAAASGGSGGGARAAVSVRLLWGQGPGPLPGLAGLAFFDLQYQANVPFFPCCPKPCPLQARRAVCRRGRGAAGGAGGAGGGAPAPCPADRRLLRVHRRGARLAQLCAHTAQLRLGLGYASFPHPPPAAICVPPCCLPLPACCTPSRLPPAIPNPPCPAGQ